MYLISYGRLGGTCFIPMFVCNTRGNAEYWVKTLKTNLPLLAKELQAYPKPVYPKPSSSLSRKDCEKLQLEILCKYGEELEKICTKYNFPDDWIYTDLVSVKEIEFCYQEIEER